jgi:K+-sensing histidine kinase KdpD
LYDAVQYAEPVAEANKFRRPFSSQEGQHVIVDDTVKYFSTGTHRADSLSILEARVRDLEAQLRDARAAVTSERARADGWLSAISHDLRGPLTLVLGHSQQAIDRLKHREGLDRVPSDLHSIQHATRRITIILDQIVDTARIEQDCLELLVEATDVSEAVRTSLLQSRRRFLQHRFRSYVARELPLAVADRRQVSRVLGILLTNAANFSSPGSMIRISARALADSVVVSVSDTGVGLSADELTRVFERSYRPARYADIHRDGLGLSLWIAKGLIAKMDGDLTVESDGAGLGATFSIRLVVFDETCQADVAEFPSRA